MINNDLPFSAACENNKLPIYETLKDYITGGSLLEIGHGTGQHALYLSQKLNINWQPCDMQENLWMMQERLKLFPSKLILPPKDFMAQNSGIKTSVTDEYDSVFSANTLHIMSEQHAKTLLTNISIFIKSQGYLFFYGPFKFQAQFTSDSNANFDQMLKERNALSGIRDFEMIQSLLGEHKIHFIKRHDLPANNQLLVFKKSI